MAEQENKEYILTKKRLDITAEERQSVIKPLGIAGLPFPTADLVKNANGEWVYELFVVQDTRKPVVVFSDRSIEQVTGEMYRDMAVPAMMYLEQEILEHTDPKRGDRVLFLLGDTGWGKTHGFKKIGRMLHPEGAVVVDMGGMNAQELIWKTVIDYGKGVRELFDKRLQEGKVSEDTLKLLEEQFPGSVVKAEKEGDPAKINWEAVGARKQVFNEAEQKMETVEDRGAAVKRAKEIMEHVYEREKITTQENAFGIKTVPGELWEAWESGRPFLADEFTKAIPSTINSLQSVLEVMNGNNQYFRALNPTPESNRSGDNDSPPFLEFRASDMRGSFVMAMAGNEANDGVTTFALSDSTSARTIELHVGDAQQIDWAQRTAQIWTGMPLTTLNTIMAPAIASDPAGYANFLLEMRTLGLSQEQVAAIPPLQLEALKRYNETASAANQAAGLWYTEDRLSKEDPEFLKKEEYKDLIEELSEKGKRLNVTPRKIIQISTKAQFHSARPRPISEAKVNFNLKATLAALDTSVVGDTEPAWRNFGENLSIAIRRDLANGTVGMRHTRAALMKLAEDQGITAPDFREAQVSETVKTISNLLRFDDHVEAGGSKELNDMREVLLTALRAQFKNLHGSDDSVLPLSSLARAVKDIETKKDANQFAFVVPNSKPVDIVAEPLVVGAALPIYELDEPENSDEFELVDFRSALASLFLPQYAEKNLERIWPTGFIGELTKPPKPKMDDENNPILDTKGNPIPDLEPYKIAEGKGEWGLNLVILRVADTKGNVSNLWVIEDKTKLENPKDGKTDWHRYMLVGPEPIPPEMEVALAKNGMTYTVKSDPASLERINNFLIEGAEVRGNDAALSPEEAKAVTESIVKSFAVLHTLPRVKPGTNPKVQIIPSDATLGEMIHNSNDKESPALYVSIVKPKAAAMAPK